MESPRRPRQPAGPPTKTYESTDADMRGTRSITELFGRDQPGSTRQKGELPQLTVPSKSSSSAHPSISGASAEPITSSTSASCAQPSTTASAVSGVLAAGTALPAALLHAASSGLAALAAYASGSEDEGENHAAPAINVETAALIAEEQRVQELCTKWTQEVFKQQKGKIFLANYADLHVDRPSGGIVQDQKKEGERRKDILERRG